MDWDLEYVGGVLDLAGRGDFPSAKSKYKHNMRGVEWRIVHQQTLATLFITLQIYLLCTDILLPKTPSNKADMMAYFPHARLYALKKNS